MTAALMAATTPSGVLPTTVAFASKPYTISNGGGTTTFSAGRDGLFTGDTANADWCSPKYFNVGDAYDVKMTVSSGTLTGDATGVYLQLNVSRTWQCAAGTGASATVVIRKRPAGADLDSASVSFLPI